MNIYDKEGQPISMERFCRLLDRETYKRVALTEIGPYEISTVWIGLDHNFLGRGRPLIFETMVFTSSAWRETRPHDDPERELLLDLSRRRWSTEQEALEGHEEFCTLVRATWQPDLDMEGNKDGRHQGEQGETAQDPAEEPEEAPGDLPQGSGGVPPADDRRAGPGSG